MNETRSFEHRLGLWLDEGPQSAPPDLLGEVLEAAAAIPHARRVGPWRLPPWLAPTDAAPGSTARQARLLLAAAALLAIAIGAVMTIGRPAIPLPTPIATPGPTPTRLPASNAVAPGCLIEHAPVPNAWPSFDPATVAGRIAYTAGHPDSPTIRAVDPAHPEDVLDLASNVDFEPVAWAPNGSALLLFGPIATISGLLLYSADGTITQITERGLSGTFSPDGRRIAYIVPGEGICITNADGTDHRTLAADPSEPFPESVAWSPDGARLAFIDFVEDSLVYGHHAVGLSFIDSDGSNLQQLVLFFGTEAFAQRLAWSPDGSTLALTLEVGRVPRIYLVWADGTNAREVLHVGPAISPQWSPDGTRIAYTFLGQLSTIAADGTDYQPVKGPEPSSAPGSGGIRAGHIAWNPLTPSP